MVTCVCVSVCLCLSVAVCPHYCTDPDVTWESGRGCPLVVHYWVIAAEFLVAAAAAAAAAATVCDATTCCCAAPLLTLAAHASKLCCIIRCMYIIFTYGRPSERIQAIIFWHLLKKTINQDTEWLSFHNTARLAVSGLSVSDMSLYSATGRISAVLTTNAGLSALEQSNTKRC